MNGVIPKAWVRREEILRIVENLGTARISKVELARKYGVSPRQITKDFEAIADRISKPNKKELCFNINIVFEFAINKLLEIARTENLKPMEKVKAIHYLVNAVDKKIDSLIKLGLIKPTEENITVQHHPNSALYEHIVQVARKLRARKNKNKKLCLKQS
ncbi:MAG: hypothetical protein JW744_00385 [Candidatus Diapherotrites archaeon]|uniref:Uncharacterized protein n=1 Tax=Candidatus Iainarchaeum sp. TaxID=3101447 RepID=A0A938YVL0_9ARCH|nr:hypothetical protein [Candidatus Diapherotrites archaeon]